MTKTRYVLDGRVGCLYTRTADPDTLYGEDVNLAFKAVDDAFAIEIANGIIEEVMERNSENAPGSKKWQEWADEKRCYFLLRKGNIIVWRKEWKEAIPAQPAMPAMPAVPAGFVEAGTSKQKHPD